MIKTHVFPGFGLNASQPNALRGHWIRWRSKFGNQPQNVAEQIPWDGDLGHLKRDIAPMADDLRADALGKEWESWQARTIHWRLFRTEGLAEFPAHELMRPQRLGTWSLSSKASSSGSPPSSGDLSGSILMLSLPPSSIAARRKVSSACLTSFWRFHSAA